LRIQRSSDIGHLHRVACWRDDDDDDNDDPSQVPPDEYPEEIDLGCPIGQLDPTPSPP
jgi:hypothetical protein